MYTLYDAIALGNEEMVRNAIRQGFDVNFMGSESVSPLIYAICRRQSVPIIQALIEEGANVNLAYLGDMTPLMCAVYKQDRDTVALLLANKADPNAMGLIQDTVLSHAIFRGDLEIVRLLVEAGADVNAKTRHGTELSLAKSWSAHSERYFEMVKCLEEFGAIDQ